ncbi:unnamed protein product [Closterium sp. Yama58-4]|nr:unnamed protein product [Closterium sp. Yama58-4]
MGEEVEMPRWAELLRSGVDIFALDFDAIIAGMYAMTVSSRGDCYLCVPPDPGIEAVALGASESALSGTASAEALHTFTLDSVLAHFSTVLPCTAVPSNSLSGLHLPSFSTNLTLHMDVWGPACVQGQGREGYFLLVVNDYSRYTTVFPLRTKGGGHPPVVHASGLTAADGVAERRIGLVMEVARTSMIHAAAPHFLWPFAVRYAAHQLNLWPRVSLLETSPIVCWMGEVGDASWFRVWGSRAFVRDTTADKLSSRAILCVFLGFPCDAPGWQFYHPTSRRLFPTQNVTFDESVPFYRLFPYRTAPLPPLLLFLAPGPPLVDPLPPQGPAPSGVSQVDPLLLVTQVLLGVVLLEVLRLGVLSLSVRSLGVLSLSVRSQGVLRLSVRSLGVLSLSVLSLGVLLLGVLSRVVLLLLVVFQRPRHSGLPSLSFSHHSSCTSGLRGAHAFGVALELEVLELEVLELEVLALEVQELEVLTLEVLELEVLELEVLELEALELEALALEALELEVLTLEVLELEALELEVLELEALEFEALELEALALELLKLEVLALEALELEALCSSDRFSRRRRSCPPESVLRQSSQSPSESVVSLRLVLLPLFALYVVLIVSLVRVLLLCQALRPSSVPQRIPLSSPPTSSLLDDPDPESDRVRAAIPTVTRLLATVVTDPSFECTAASALVVELVDFAAACRLDYATSLVAESEYVCPPSVGGECALGTDVLEDRQEDFECLAGAGPYLVAMLPALEGDSDALDIPTPRSYAEAITGPYSSQWQTAMDAEIPSWKSTGTYVDAFPPLGTNIVDGMWIFRVKRPPGSPPVYKARYVARGFSQRQGVDYFQTFSPTPKMTTLWVLLHVVAQRDYELHSLDFSIAFLQGSMHEEIWLRHPPGFTGSFPPGTQWSLQRPVYGLRQAPCEWHDTLRTTLAALGFAPSTADPLLFLRTDTSLPPFYILVYIDNLVFATAGTEALALVKSEL